MSTTKRDDIAKKLLAHRQAFVANLPEKLTKIEESWQLLVEKSWSTNTLSNLHRMVHSLSGSCGTFGLLQAGEMAHNTATLLVILSKQGTPATKQQQKKIQNSLKTLADAIQNSLQKSEQQEESTPESPRENTLKPDRQPTIYMVECDDELAQTLATQLGFFGYSVKIFTTLATFKRTLQQHNPAVILMDTSRANEIGLQKIEKLQKNRSQPLPIICLTNSHDLALRLQSVALGCQGFCQKPVNFTQLITTLDRITYHDNQQPYRVIVIDASQSLAEYYALVLRNVGMQVHIITDPWQTTEILSIFKADLVVLDLHISQPSGLILANTIRLHPSFINLPFLFVTDQPSLDKSLTSIQADGDSIVSKPIKPDTLVYAATKRAQKYRMLQSLINRDHLTGLPNYAQFYTRFKHSLNQAQQSQQDCSFAIIDIDQLRQINHNHGEIIGDQVIKSLAQLITHTSRPHDFSGHLCGGQFALMLPNTPGKNAWKILDQLRQTFSKLLHQHEPDYFSATFSCGIASFPTKTTQKLYNAAEKAVQIAKSSGGNNMELLTSEA